MRLKPDELADVVHFVDAVDLLRQHGFIDDAQVQFLTGFGLRGVEYKAELIGIPFLIIEAEIKTGKSGSQYAQMYIIDTLDRRVILRDSSRGIFEQVQALMVDAGKDVLHGLYVNKGLRVEEGTHFHPALQKTVPVQTYYLNY